MSWKLLFLFFFFLTSLHIVKLMLLFFFLSPPLPSCFNKGIVIPKKLLGVSWRILISLRRIVCMKFFNMLKLMGMLQCTLELCFQLNLFDLSGLLYYAGHGYENYGNSFMVPIDAPNPYRSANCLCVQNILKLMQEKETGLNVFLLDMCRKRYSLIVHEYWEVLLNVWGMFLVCDRWGESIMIVVSGTSCEVQFIHCSKRLKCSLLLKWMNEIEHLLWENSKGSWGKAGLQA